MVAVSRRAWLLLLSLLWHCNAHTASQTANLQSQPWSQALEQFFETIDKDGDGQIEPAEALQYIDANFDSSDIRQDLGQAAQHMRKNLDGSDSDVTISKEEVENHLRKLLKGNRVAEWLKHSAQLPQYAKAFKDNSITSLDFPSLVADGGSMLEAEIGIKSQLHREQLVRALKRVILGIGATPSSPRDMQCIPLSCDSMALRWHSPERLGIPPLHKYKLERQRTRVLSLPVAAPVWETANGELDDEDTSWIDTDLQVGEYEYRMTAWNALGWSEYSFLKGCNTANASLPCPPQKCWNAAACTQAAGASVSSPQTAAEGVLLWKLLCSVGGIAAVSLAMSARLLNSKQHAGLQDTLLHKCACSLGLSKPNQAEIKIEHQGHGDEQVNGFLKPDELAQHQHNRSESGGSLQPVNGMRRLGSSRHLVHNDSNNSRTSGASGSPPRKRSQLQASRSDLFFPREVETFQGQDALGSSAAPLPNLRTGNRSQHAALSGEQEVLWLDDEGVEVNPPPVLDIPTTPQHAGPNACAFPGCEKSLHPIFNPRAALTSHYCSICQSVVCQRHTQYSPHGRLGSCGMESKCICQVCYEDLPQVTQDRLDRSNKLSKGKKEGPQLPTGSKTAEKQWRGSLFGGGKSNNNLLQDGHPGSSSSSEPPQPARSSSGRERGQPSSGAQNWGRLRTALRAASHFRGAGRERRSRSEDGTRAVTDGAEQKLRQ